MPMRETVAGEANLRSWVSKIKLTLGPNWMRSPDGIVSSRLSSSTELSDSTHSGSMSPSQMIHDLTSAGSRTTLRAEAVSTPSNHSRVSMSMCPSSCSRGIALGFITYVGILRPSLALALSSSLQMVDLPVGLE